MKKLFIILAIGFLFYNYHQRTKIIPAPFVTFTDAEGASRSLPSMQNKPAVVTFWISPCGYSDRAMKILAMIRSKYSEEQLDVVGFYANPVSNEQILVDKPYSKFPFIRAAAQQTPFLADSLFTKYPVRGGGSDIFVIDRRGMIHTIDVRSDSKTADQLFLDVLATLEPELGSG